MMESRSILSIFQRGATGMRLKDHIRRSHIHQTCFPLAFMFAGYFIAVKPWHCPTRIPLDDRIGAVVDKRYAGPVAREPDAFLRQLVYTWVKKAWEWTINSNASGKTRISEQGQA
jgi:hypothetical protein